MKTSKNIVMKGWVIQIASEHPSCYVEISCENGAVVELYSVDEQVNRKGNRLAYQFASQSDNPPVTPELPVHVQVEKWDIELNLTHEGHLTVVFASILNHPVGLLTSTNGNAYAPACTLNMEIEQTGMFSVEYAGMTLTVYDDAELDTIFPSIYSSVPHNTENLRTLLKMGRERAENHGYYGWNDTKGQYWCQGHVVSFKSLIDGLSAPLYEYQACWEMIMSAQSAEHAVYMAYRNYFEDPVRTLQPKFWVQPSEVASNKDMPWHILDCRILNAPTTALKQDNVGLHSYDVRWCFSIGAESAQKAAQSVAEKVLKIGCAVPNQLRLRHADGGEELFFF